MSDDASRRRTLDLARARSRPARADTRGRSLAATAGAPARRTPQRATGPVAVRGELQIDYHQLFLAEDEYVDSVEVGTEAAFTSRSVDERTVIVHTGIAAGPVAVDVLAVRAEPSADEAAGGRSWEEHDRQLVRTSSGLLSISSLGGVDVPAHLTDVWPYGPALVAVAVFATGRGAAPDAAVDEVLERYRLVLWPAAAGSTGEGR